MFYELVNANFTDTFKRHSASEELTHCVLMTPYVDKRRVNFDSGNRLLPGSTKTLPNPVLTYHQ